MKKSVNPPAVCFAERETAKSRMVREQMLAKDIFETITDVFFALDNESRFTYINHHAELMYNIVREKHLGQSIFDLFPNIRDTIVQEQYEKAMRDQVPVEFEWLSSYTNRWLEIRAYPSPDWLLIYIHDITQRKQAKEQLSESQERYRLLFNSIDQGFCVTEVLFSDLGNPVDYRFLEINPTFAKMTGISSEAALSGKTVRELIPDIEDKWIKKFGEIALNGKHERFVEKSRLLGRWFDIYAFRIGGDGSQKIAVFFNDITERKLSEQSLLDSENKYRTLIEQASDGIHTYDFEGNFLDVNTRLCEMLGYTAEELLQMNVKDCVPPGDLETNPIRFNELIAGKSIIRERTLRRKDGTIFPVEISGRMIKQGVLQGIIRDITERKLAEQILRRSNEELEFLVRQRTEEVEKANVERVQVLHQLVTAQEDERRRIARDLHDELGQQMTVLRIEMERLKNMCGENEELQKQVEVASRIARQLDSDVDFLAWQVRPTVLDDIGIVAAINQYVQQWSEHFKISVDFQAKKFRTTRLKSEIETSFYRIMQEALNNVSKHSKASSVNIFLKPRDKSAVLIIEDNGIGFEPEKEDILRKSMGLTGMYERAALIGGTLEIESAKGSGTTIYVTVPISTDGTEKE
ncbi:MAG: signal transduction histidine kinase [Acidobacteria bacterium]|nr:signal transduction histidine kinase [Acidobacteriota bacterium]